MMHAHAALTLVQASREQVLASWKRHVKQWGQGLSEEKYLVREKQFERNEHASDGKMTVWALVPKDDIRTLDFLCSCETFRRRAWRVKPSSSEPEEVTGYGIASVFCPPENRRNGYASHMMRLLHHVLAPTSTYPTLPDLPQPLPGIGKDALFSVLYSDVGDFYKSCGPVPHAPGWNIQGAVSTRWPLTLPADPSDPPTALLTLEQCKFLWEADERYMYDVLKQQAPITRFTFKPTGGVAAFTAIRAAAFFPEGLAPKHWGVELQHSPEDAPTYATWTFDECVLVITRMRATPMTLPALIRAVSRAALAIDMTAVEAWDLTPELQAVAARVGGTTVTRKDHLPAVAWYGPENPGAVKWVFNEK